LSLRRTSAFVILTSDDVFVPPSGDVVVADTAMILVSVQDASASQVVLPRPTQVITGDIRVLGEIQGRITVVGGS